MELTPALDAKVTKAVWEALKEVKPMPAVDGIAAKGSSGKYAKFV